MSISAAIMEPETSCLWWEPHKSPEFMFSSREDNHLQIAEIEYFPHEVTGSSEPD